MTDDFNGNDAQLISCIEALLAMDAKGILRPHGIGGHGRTLLGAAAARLAARCNDTAPVAPIGDARNATIEECAFVAEHGGIFGVVIAVRIRKLKGQ